MKLIQFYGFQEGYPNDASSHMWSAGPISPSFVLFLAAPFLRSPSNAGMDCAVALMSCSGSDSPFLASLAPRSRSGTGSNLTV